MLIQSKHDGRTHRAIKLDGTNLITDNGLLLPGSECLVFAENTWWRFEQVRLRTSAQFLTLGISLPDETHYRPPMLDIVQVKLPERIANIVNLNCITPR